MSRAGQLAIAMGVGLALGAVAVAGYAYLVRVPLGQSARYLAPASQLLLQSLIAVCVVAVATVAIGVLTMIGRPHPGYASALLAGTVAVAAYAYLSSSPSAKAGLISGPGARPAIAIAQVGWVLLAFAVVMMIAGATSATRELDSRPSRAAAVACTAVGVAVAVVASITVMTLSDVSSQRATTAERMPIPAVPTAVGTEVAYTVNLPTNMVVPAGPGFVGVKDRAAIAFDGITGAERWRFPFSDFPANCNYDTMQSTGVVVVVQCTRPPNQRDTSKTDYSSDQPEYDGFLIGLDAVTGERLWMNDDNWRLQGRAIVDTDMLAALSTDRVGALDPRTGRTKWTRERADDPKCRESWYGTFDQKIGYLDACGATLHLYDANTDTPIDISTQPGIPPGKVDIEVMAAEGDVVALEVNQQDTGLQSALLAINTRTNTVQVVATRYLRSIFDLRILIPGPILELDDDSRGRTVRLYLTAEERAVQVADIEMLVDPQLQRWAKVGDQLVTGAAYQGDYDGVIATVSPTGQVAHQPNPCGESAAGVQPVPGAVLLLCGRYAAGSTSITNYDVIGLR